VAWAILVAAVLGACGREEAGDERPTSEIISDNSDVRSTETSLPARATPLTSPVPEASLAPTASEEIVAAMVWPAHPQVPILTYHRFLPDTYAQSTAVKTRFADFRSHLERLYDAGYSVIPLESWLAGELNTPTGRRPLIITIDDAFFADQISLIDDGEISPQTGIGVMWEFYREHPEFGFSAALFASLGDKLYLGGEEALAKAIVWGLEHGIIPYNHFYSHPRLDLTENRWIPWEAEKNDLYLRKLLASQARSDLTDRLGNILALPYGVWPLTEAGRAALLGYVNPEGMPVQAVLEVDYAYRARLAEAPYAEDFDPLHVPRIVGTLSAIAVLEELAQGLPLAAPCELRSEGDLPEGSDKWEAEIERARHERCGPGLYVIGNSIYDALGDEVQEIFVTPYPSK
jgi:hypothetical protein